MGKDLLKIEEFGIVSLNEVENHRIEGELFLQYNVPELNTSESCTFRLVIHRSEVGVDDFRRLSMLELETLLKQKLFTIVSLLHTAAQENVKAEKSQRTRRRCASKVRLIRRMT